MESQNTRRGKYAKSISTKNTTIAYLCGGLTFFEELKIYTQNVLKCKLFEAENDAESALRNTRSNVEYTITTDHVVHSCNVLKLSLTTSDSMPFDFPNPSDASFVSCSIYVQ